MSQKIKQFQTFLNQSIPLTKDMGLQLNEFTGSTLKLTAPLLNNINDKGSVFGGSSSALMIIAAWSLIKLNCDDHGIDADIVIHKNETLWTKPLYSDLILDAEFDEKYDFNQISQILKSKRHQKINCQISLKDVDGNNFSTMKAKYVIIPK